MTTYPFPVGTAAPGAAPSQDILVGGVYSSTPQTVANGQGVALQVDANGRLLTLDKLQDVAFISASVTAAGTILSQDTTGYGSIVLDIPAAGTGNTIVFEASPDNFTTTFSAVGTPTASTGSNSPATSASAAGSWVFPAIFQYFRARCSVYGSGTIQAGLTLRQAPATTVVAAYIGNNPVLGVSSSSTSRMSIARIIAATSGVIKASGGNLFQLQLSNTIASWRYLKLYNQTTAPTIGTGTPIATIGVPPGLAVQLSAADIGTNFSTGISWVMTGGAADADSTAATANDIVGTALYA